MATAYEVVMDTIMAQANRVVAKSTTGLSPREALLKVLGVWEQWNSYGKLSITALIESP